jgi:hypothetical protein
MENGLKFWLPIEMGAPGLLGELNGCDYRTGSADTDQNSQLLRIAEHPGCKPDERIRARDISQGNTGAVTIGRQALRGQCDDGCACKCDQIHRWQQERRSSQK